MQEILLTSENIWFFGDLIPNLLQDDVKKGNLVGVGTVDLDYGENMAVSALLFREHHGWLDLVWIATKPEYQDRGEAQWLLDRRIAGARGTGHLWGVKMDIPEGEASGALKHMLKNRGFQFSKVDLPTYVITVDALRGHEILDWRKAGTKIVPLIQMSAELRDQVVHTMRKREEVLPITYPIDWKRYDDKLSAMCLCEGKIGGLLLATRTEQSITLDFVWARYKTAVMMLSYASKWALTIESPETEIVIPTVTEMSAKMVRRAFPDVVQLQVEQAKKMFYEIPTELMELASD